MICMIMICMFMIMMITFMMAKVALGVDGEQNTEQSCQVGMGTRFHDAHDDDDDDDDDDIYIMVKCMSVCDVFAYFCV